MNRLNETESAVFLYCRFSLFLKYPFFHIIQAPVGSDQFAYQYLIRVYVFCLPPVEMLGH